MEQTEYYFESDPLLILLIEGAVGNVGCEPDTFDSSGRGESISSLPL